MTFFGLLWGYITRVPALAAARNDASVRWSFLFQLHVLVAFLVALAFVGDVLSLVQTAQKNMARVPDGIVVEKRADTLRVVGAPQPFTFQDFGMVITVDTIGALKSRPASTTVFITDKQIITVDATGKERAMFWNDERDFTENINDIKKFWLASERKLIVIGISTLFVAIMLFEALVSLALVIVWSLLGVVFGRLFGTAPSVTFREAARVHAVCLTGPLVLWGVLTAGGFAIALPVEVLAFIVYSMMALPIKRA